MRNCLIHGFTRLGIGAAVLIATYGFVLTGIATVSKYKANARPGILPADPTTDEVRKARLPGANIYAQIVGPPPAGLNEISRHRTAALYAARAAGIGFGITVLASLAVFGSFRGLG